MSDTTPNYYSLVKHSEVRDVIKEKKIEVCRILSEKISEEILKEAEKCHVMTYISLEFLNSASDGIVTAWNFDKYKNNILQELEKEKYSKHTEILYNSSYDILYGLYEDGVLFYPLYKLTGTSSTEEKENKETGNYESEYKINLKLESSVVDGFFIFWDNQDEENQDYDKTDGKNTSEYIIRQIYDTEVKILQEINKFDSDGPLNGSGDGYSFIRTLHEGQTYSTKVSTETEQQDFISLVDKYNSYKEVRI